MSDPLSRKPIAGVANVIGVASGKGGVGKSTVAVNLACALAQSGAKVGMLDADIYGPSVPMMMNAVGEQLEADAQTQRPFPIERYGVKLVSIGFVSSGNDPIIWRGPIVSRAIQQLLNDVLWGELDYLIVDLPPGTGDAPLTLAQVVPLSGVVIVLTPQDVAINIAAKSLAMFQRPPFEVPILGIVENMSSFICPHCHQESHIFGEATGQQTAEGLGVSLLGSVPLAPTIADAGDAGKPIVLAAPDSPPAAVFRKIATEVSTKIGELAKRGQEQKTGGTFIGLERFFNPRSKSG